MLDPEKVSQDRSIKLPVEKVLELQEIKVRLSIEDS